MDIACPHCGGQVAVPETLIGTRLVCPYCRRRWTVGQPPERAAAWNDHSPAEDAVSEPRGRQLAGDLSMHERWLRYRERYERQRRRHRRHLVWAGLAIGGLMLAALILRWLTA